MTNPGRASRKFRVGTLQAPTAFAQSSGEPKLIGFAVRTGTQRIVSQKENNSTARGRDQCHSVTSSRQFDGVFVSENANGLLELIDLKRFL